MPAVTQNDTKGNTGDSANVSTEDAARIYAKINKEVAALMTGNESIVFGPAEDFEYTAPLEDFKKSREASPR